jgi:hypothetical protein
MRFTLFRRQSRILAISRGIPILTLGAFTALRARSRSICVRIVSLFVVLPVNAPPKSLVSARCERRTAGVTGRFGACGLSGRRRDFRREQALRLRRCGDWRAAAGVSGGLPRDMCGMPFAERPSTQRMPSRLPTLVAVRQGRILQGACSAPSRQPDKAHRRGRSALVVPPRANVPKPARFARP